jgi:iron complex outermembrane receptor protein
VTNSPEWSLNLAYEHIFDLGRSGTITAGADSRIESSRFVAIDFTPETHQGAYTMTNARITWQDAAERFSIGAYINNIENSLVFANSLQSPAKPGTFYNQLRPPRTFGVRVGAKF